MIKKNVECIIGLFKTNCISSSISWNKWIRLTASSYLKKKGMKFGYTFNSKSQIKKKYMWCYILYPYSKWDIFTTANCEEISLVENSYYWSVIFFFLEIDANESKKCPFLSKKIAVEPVSEEIKTDIIQVTGRNSFYI